MHHLSSTTSNLIMDYNFTFYNEKLCVNHMPSLKIVNCELEFAIQKGIA